MLMDECGSAENFLSDKEVIIMLDNLHRQKMHAESQASLLQEQINCECPCPVVELGGREVRKRRCRSAPAAQRCLQPAFVGIARNL